MSSTARVPECLRYQRIAVAGIRESHRTAVECDGSSRGYTRENCVCETITARFVLSVRIGDVVGELEVANRPPLHRLPTPPRGILHAAILGS